MNPYLFVYGTLKYDSHNHMARFLRGHADFLGEATMPGRIFQLHDYPGAVFDENSASVVSGHLFKLHNPGFILRVLDKYEGIGDEFPQPNEYRRMEKLIRFGEKTIHSWVFLYNLQPPAGPGI
jgi:gamma-glutamylcyclotransferase (GGCT)/AIG2-like uncharacterized protein YtfP